MNASDHSSTERFNLDRTNTLQGRQGLHSWTVLSRRLAPWRDQLILNSTTNPYNSLATWASISDDEHISWIALLFWVMAAFTLYMVAENRQTPLRCLADVTLAKTTGQREYSSGCGGR